MTTNNTNELHLRFHSPIPMEKKITFAQAYLQLGSLRRAVEIADVNYDTAKGWIKTPWFKDILNELRKEQQQELATRLGSIANLALATLEDRVKNGEHIYNHKTGELIRKPIGARDANQVTQNLITQKIKLEKLVQQETGQQDTVQDVLKQLAAEFAKFNSAEKKKNAIDVAYKEI
jgi:hypothetical protein